MPNKSKFVHARSRLLSLWPQRNGIEMSELLLLERRAFIPPAWRAGAPDLLKPLIDGRAEMEDVAFVRAYRGALSLDPVSGHVFAGGRYVPGSTDLPAERTRERLPRFWTHLAPPAERLAAVISLHNKF